MAHQRVSVHDPFSTRMFSLVPIRRVANFGVVKYIVSNCDGIGERIAARLYERFGDTAVEVLRENPFEASTAIGIKMDVAEEASGLLAPQPHRDSVTMLPPSMPRRQNPQMHLFEAMIAHLREAVTAQLMRVEIMAQLEGQDRCDMVLVMAGGNDVIRLRGLRPGADGGGSVLEVGELPHDAVFGRCAAVVHHAGAGTAQTALAAGAVSVSLPLWGDQPFWARRLQALGVAPPPVPRARWSRAAIGAALARAVGEPWRRERAGMAATRMAAEGGAAGAAQTVLRIVTTSRGR